MWKSVGHRGCKLASRFYHSHCSLAIIKLIAEFLLTMLIHTDTQSYITNFFFFFWWRHWVFLQCEGFRSCAVQAQLQYMRLPWPGTEPSPLALGAKSLTHWMTGKSVLHDQFDMHNLFKWDWNSQQWVYNHYRCKSQEFLIKWPHWGSYWSHTCRQFTVVLK